MAFNCHSSQTAATLDRVLEVTELMIMGPVASKRYVEKEVTSTINRAGTRTQSTSDMVVTEYEIEIDEVLHGSYSEDSLVITEIGGSKNGISVQFSMAYSLEEREKIVAFLYWDDSLDSWRSVAFGQTILEISGDKGEEQIVSANHDFLLRSDSDDRLLLDPADDSLEHFLQRINDHLGESN